MEPAKLHVHERRCEVNMELLAQAGFVELPDVLAPPRADALLELVRSLIEQQHRKSLQWQCEQELRELR